LSGCASGPGEFNAQGYTQEGTSIDTLHDGIVPMPRGVLDLSGVAIRKAFETLPPAIEADTASQVAIAANAITDGGTVEGLFGSGFKVGKDIVVTARHIAFGEDPSSKPNEIIVSSVPRTVGGPSAGTSGYCAAGSNGTQGTRPDIGVVRVRDAPEFDRLRNISLSAREIQPSPDGARAVYIISFQPGADRMSREPALANDSVNQFPPYLQYPDITAGLLVDAKRGVPTGEDLVVTGIKSYAEDGRTESVDGSSGGAVIDGVNNRVGWLVTGGGPEDSSGRPERLSPAAFYAKFGVHVKSKNALSYSFVQPIDKLAVNALAAQTQNCAKPLLP